MKVIKFELKKNEYEKFIKMTTIEFYTELQANFLSPSIIYGSGFKSAEKPYIEHSKYYMKVYIG